jgi:hypothetical protein
MSITWCKPILLVLLVLLLLAPIGLEAITQQPDTIVIQRNDTIIEMVRPGGIPKKQIEGRKLEEILENYSESNYFSRKLHEWLVKSSLDKLTPDQDPSNIRLNNNFVGKKVANIDIRHVPPFGGSIEDTMAVANSWLGQLGNRLRFETASGIITNTITIQKDQKIESPDIYDSERLLRALSFINDVRIVVWPHASGTNAVNVSIYVKDRYPHAISFGFNDEYPSITLINKNLFGRGLSLSHSLVAPSARISEWGFRETLGAENFMGRYIDLEIDYSNIQDLHLIGGKIERNFILPQIKYAGGALINRSFQNPQINSYPLIEWEPPLNFRRQNFWLGRSFLLSNISDYRSNFYVMTRYMDLKLFNNAEEPNFIPTGEFFYSGIAFSKQGYYKNNLIFSHGRTEDVPFGSLISLAYGYHKGNVLNRHFAGLHYSYGKALIPSQGYLYLSGDIGSYFKSGETQQGYLKIVSEYITPLISLGQNKLRNFFEIQYVNGLNRLPDEYLFIDEEVNGLHRFDYHKSIKGSEKIILKTEQVLFTRTEPLGFKFAAFSFFDTAFLKENAQKTIFQQQPYFSFGGGLRIRNDNLVFNTLQIRLAIMPRIPHGEFPLSLRTSGEPAKTFRNFIPKPPGSNAYY